MAGALRISVVVPALNEAAGIVAALRPALREADEVIVVDGGSADATVELARAAGAKLVTDAARGRAAQMNAGAAVASGEVLLFLHADTRLPEGWAAALRASLAARHWGRFDVSLDAPGRLLAIVGAMMNLRSRLSGICTGDQAIFVARAAWRRVGGFPPIALMEDIEISRRLKRVAGPPACLRERVAVSARRWQARGALRTIVGMWWWRALYFLGASPDWLHARYYGRRRGRA
ncbi:TIGR04283 family arsenosugar biosynthesis glycosyltransferase [Burkholderiaceae bacterium FT117]|uniref:TIGR04283 family arsenosugar biosynthesis glycosyltransferase n=1 Tax=Zeimonas sediminis TaxID=2944268 RepID=UPI002342DBD1|nr:TIGR04283 family arsenosugar biosynthesis glycosyltransferase [Zeimonas sediminis]MCM5569084.1 TIGR04283 family arsenosugar biosynthesis glycosyltransferase [Zeimonas sediminis]